MKHHCIRHPFSARVYHTGSVETWMLHIDTFYVDFLCAYCVLCGKTVAPKTSRC